MNKTLFKIISLLICLGILAACSPGQTLPPVSTTPVIPTVVVQSPQSPPAPPASQASPAVGTSWEFENPGNTEGWVVNNEITGLQVSQG